MEALFLLMIVAGAIDGLLIAYKYSRTRELSLLSRLIARIAFIVIVIIGSKQDILNTEMLLQMAVVVLFAAGIMSNVTYLLGKKYRDRLEINRLNKTMEELKHKYITALESAPVGFYVLNPEGKVEYANKKACDMLGYDKLDIINKPIYKVIATYDTDKVYENIQNRVTGRVPSATYTVDLVKKSGELLRVRVFSNQTINGHLTITGSIIAVDECSD